MSGTPYLACSTSVRAVDFGHVLVLVDYRTGRVRCLLPAAAEHWNRAARTGTSDGMPPALLRSLVASGLLFPTTAARPWPAPVDATAVERSAASAEFLAGTSRPERSLPLRVRLGATASLAAVTALQRTGAPGLVMQRVTTALKAAAAADFPAATDAQVRTAVLAVRNVGWWSPGRTACLEESAAAALLLASQRLSSTWCHGIAPDPVRLHAWVQTADGEPVAEPPTTLAYTPVLTIGAPHHHHP